jgi:hypothetical protein
MSSLRARIGRLVEKIGTPDEPKAVIITTQHYWHSIEDRGEWVGLGVPWRAEYVENADPMEDLTPEQRALIGPNDKVVILVLPPNGRDECPDALGL